MKSTKMIALLAMGCVIFQLAQLINANCVCKEKGIDYCQACSETKIVRPKPKPYLPNPDLELPPIGDNCWCSKLLIEPAALPKPPCLKHKTPTCSCNVKGYGYDSPPPPPPPLTYGVPTLSYDKPLKDDSLPADPISVSLAIKAGKAIGVPEAKLAYGFVQKPIDALKQIYFSSVPEENLYKLKSDVITLKKRIYAPPKEEEIIEEEEEEALVEEDEPPYLTYKELGYVPEKFKNPKFKEISSAYIIAEEPAYKPAYVPAAYGPPAYAPAAYGPPPYAPAAYEPPVYKPKPLKKCGYRPGRILPCGKQSAEVDGY